MPFWWKRRKRFMWNRRRPLFKRKRRYWRTTRRRPYRRSYRRTHRRRRRRRAKVRRKKPKLILKQWQPETIRKCKIIGLTCNCLGAQGRQFACYTDNRFQWVPPATPGGGGFGYEKYSLYYLYTENLRGNNVWTTSNNYLDLCRYTGCKIIFYRHPTISFVVQYSRTLPMIIDKYSYSDSHPYKLLQSKHHRVIPSLDYKPYGKRKVKIKIKPPRQMSTKWFFQENFADQPLLTIISAACDLKYAYQGCCNSNNLVTMFSLNLQYYQFPGWGNAAPNPSTYGTVWYIPYHGADSKTKMEGYNIDGKKVTGQVQLTVDPLTSSKYHSTINKETGWFQPNILSIIVTTSGSSSQVAPLKVQRYNPSIDTGDGNQIWLQSVLKLGNYDPPTTDTILIAESEPLWRLLWGFLDWVQKNKHDTTFLKSYFLVIKSSAIEPHTGQDKYHIPIDANFLRGKGPYGEQLTPDMIAKWYPRIEHQQETINAIVSTGPYVPKLNDQRNSTWELKSKYFFYFKWGGPEQPLPETTNPKTQGKYDVPDKLQELQIANPKKQEASKILHSWDWRRGFITKKAVKRIYEDSEADTTNTTISDSSRQHKKIRYQGNSVPVHQEDQKEIESCLLSLFEEDSSPQEETQEIQQLIQHQKLKQQQLKLNMLKLISDLKNRQRVIQLQTGLLH
nr:MAG: ORF1 [Torque teno midi virus]UHK04092.1 MAG: ORF1 [Torque teno midi virus]UHK04102.1 MAG: ORF1 [Torque teno midi virus]UHK04113.1 MAG: ORF1 [Torque teno midi virus]